MRTRGHQELITTSSYDSVSLEAEPASTVEP